MSNLKYIEDYPVNKIIPYSHNPRRNDRSVEPIMKSIQMAGFINPIIIDKHNIVLAGHARLEAVKRLGNETVGVIIADIAPDVAKAYRITDNKTSEYARWADIEKDLDHLANFEWIKAEGYNTRDTGARAKFNGMSMKDFLRWQWNTPSSANSPWRLFENVLVPDGLDEDMNIIYRYNRSASLLPKGFVKRG